MAVLGKHNDEAWLQYVTEKSYEIIHMIYGKNIKHIFNTNNTPEMIIFWNHSSYTGLKYFVHNCCYISHVVKIVLPIKKLYENLFISTSMKYYRTFQYIVFTVQSKNYANGLCLFRCGLALVDFTI